MRNENRAARSRRKIEIVYSAENHVTARQSETDINRESRLFDDLGKNVKFLSLACALSILLECFLDAHVT